MTDPVDIGNWQAVWEPVIAQIGVELGDGQTHFGADPVEASFIRRYLEPLEFDCPLHYDASTASTHGFSSVTAPYTALSTFSFPAVWCPGEAIFNSADRDAQPARASVKPRLPPGAPAVSGYFATDLETEYVRPLQVGDRVGRRGQRLIGCVPKETKVGRGAFLTFENVLVDQHEALVARTRITLFFYEPSGRASI